MPYVTSIERHGMEREARTSVFAALETRFGTVSESLTERIQKIKDTEQLRRLLRRAIQVASPQEFELELDSSTTKVQNQAVQ